MDVFFSSLSLSLVSPLFLVCVLLFKDKGDVAMDERPHSHP